jgi:hypothetical protein
MISMLRREASSGAIDDLAHVTTDNCLADCLTKASAKADALIKACISGILPKVDSHPPFRSLLKHKAYLISWISTTLTRPYDAVHFLNIPVFHDLNTLRAIQQHPAYEALQQEI